MFALVVGSLLNAFSAAIFGVAMTVVAADLTRQTGCFNLTLGALGVAVSLGASLSTFCTGISVALFGNRAAALGLALVGLCGLLLLWTAMPETRSARRVLEGQGGRLSLTFVDRQTHRAPPTRATANKGRFGAQGFWSAAK